MYQKYGKRLFDLLVSGLALVGLLPVWVVLLPLVRWKLGAPVVFRQSRPGKDGVLFTLYKFRSMTDATDAQGQLLPDSERLTRFGRLFRATSLDELPELWNIFKGDMSLVGPRPLLEEYLPLYNDTQRMRHSVRPGLTGLAQVSGRNALSWEEKFDLDVAYVRKVTFWGDMRILCLTVLRVFQRKGISQEGQATMGKFQGSDATK